MSDLIAYITIFFLAPVVLILYVIFVLPFKIVIFLFSALFNIFAKFKSKSNYY